MDDILNHIRNRKNLADRVRLLNPDQLDLELGVYNTIIAVEAIRHQRMMADAEDESREYLLDERKRTDERDQKIMLSTLDEAFPQGQDPDPGRVVPMTRGMMEQFLRAGYANNPLPELEIELQTRKNQTYKEIKRHAKRYGHLPTFIIILNYLPEIHAKHIKKGTGIFENGFYYEGEDRRIRNCIGRPFLKPTEWMLDELYSISLEDSAVTVNSQGLISGTNAEIDDQANENNTDEDKRSLNERIGLLAGGNTRQHAAYEGSGLMKGTIIYTLGESGYIRRFCEKELTQSSHAGEEHNLMLRYLEARP
ncbi:hypothetical protein JW826_04650 [Candidatus Woesearchaeota archaeon]|nr:hypothetical protein [Candidatus Woesearchaeota archaeon]